MPRRRRRRGRPPRSSRSCAPRCCAGRSRSDRPGWPSRRSGELAQLATRGIDAVDAYFARYLPQLVLTCLVPPMFVIVIWVTDWLSGLIVLLTLPVVVVFLVLIGAGHRAAEPAAVAQPGAALAPLPRRRRRADDAARVRPGRSAAALHRRGHRRLPAHHDGRAAGVVPLLVRAGAGREPLGRAGRGADRAAAAGRRPRARRGPADPAARPRRLPAAAPARRGPPRRRGGARRHRRRARRPRSPRAAGRSATGAAGGPARARSSGAWRSHRPGRSRPSRRSRWTCGRRRAGRPDRAERGRQVDAAGRAARLRPARRGTVRVGEVDLADVDLDAVARPDRLGAAVARPCCPARWPRTSRSGRAGRLRRRGARRHGAGRRGGHRPRAGARRGRRRAVRRGTPARSRWPGRYLRAERGAGLLLLDEPTAHLDGPTRERVLDGLRRVVRRPLRAAGRARPRAGRRRPTGSCGCPPPARRPLPTDPAWPWRPGHERACRCSGVTATARRLGPTPPCAGCSPSPLPTVPASLLASTFGVLAVSASSR